MRGGRRGFTLLELLITVSIIFILASIVVPLSKTTVKRGKEMELRHHLRTMRQAIDRFKEDWDRDGARLIGVLCQENRLTCGDEEVVSPYGYPKSLEVLLKVELSGEKASIRGTTIKRYLRRIPVDPITKSTDWGLRCYADDPDSSYGCGDDVFDVYTTSERTALNGTSYRDW